MAYIDYLKEEYDRQPVYYPEQVKRNKLTVESQYLAGRIENEDFAIMESLSDFFTTMENRFKKFSSVSREYFDNHKEVAGVIALVTLTVMIYGRYSPALGQKVQTMVKNGLVDPKKLRVTADLEKEVIAGVKQAVDLGKLKLNVNQAREDIKVAKKNYNLLTRVKADSSLTTPAEEAIKRYTSKLADLFKEASHDVLGDFEHLKANNYLQGRVPMSVPAGPDTYKANRVAKELSDRFHTMLRNTGIHTVVNIKERLQGQVNLSSFMSHMSGVGVDSDEAKQIFTLLRNKKVLVKPSWAPESMPYIKKGYSTSGSFIDLNKLSELNPLMFPEELKEYYIKTVAYLDHEVIAAGEKLGSFKGTIKSYPSRIAKASDPHPIHSPAHLHGSEPLTDFNDVDGYTRTKVTQLEPGDYGYIETRAERRKARRTGVEPDFDQEYLATEYAPPSAEELEMLKIIKHNAGKLENRLTQELGEYTTKELDKLNNTRAYQGKPPLAGKELRDVKAKIQYNFDRKIAQQRISNFHRRGFDDSFIDEILSAGKRWDFLLQRSNIPKEFWDIVTEYRNDTLNTDQFVNYLKTLKDVDKPAHIATKEQSIIRYLKRIFSDKESGKFKERYLALKAGSKERDKLFKAFQQYAEKPYGARGETGFMTSKSVTEVRR